MSRYNLTIARPNGFLHSSAFIEVRDSLAWALTELGHEVNCSENHLVWRDSSHPATTNILFGTETLAGTELIPDNTIIYNLEQPTHPKMDTVRRMIKGRQVWDFSQRNVEAWKKAGYDAHWVPVAYTPYLTRIPPAKTQPIDVLFYGWLTVRRMAMKAQLEKIGLKPVFTDSAYGGGRDYLIAHSKVVLNVHHDGRDMTEIVRLSYLLANHKAVISESASDDADYDLGLSLWSYEGLAQACHMAVRNDYLRQRLERETFKRFSKDKLIDHLKRVLR